MWLCFSSDCSPTAGRSQPRPGETAARLRISPVRAGIGGQRIAPSGHHPVGARRADKSRHPPTGWHDLPERSAGRQ